MSAFFELLFEIVGWRALDHGVEHGQRSVAGRILIVTLALAAIAGAVWLLTR